MFITINDANEIYFYTLGSNGWMLMKPEPKYLL